MESDSSSEWCLDATDAKALVLDVLDPVSLFSLPAVSSTHQTAKAYEHDATAGFSSLLQSSLSHYQDRDHCWMPP
mgnify:CR=1 FL=1